MELRSLPSGNNYHYQEYISETTMQIYFWVGEKRIYSTKHFGTNLGFGWGWDDCSKAMDMASSKTSFSPSWEKAEHSL